MIKLNWKKLFMRKLEKDSMKARGDRRRM